MMNLNNKTFVIEDGYLREVFEHFLSMCRKSVGVGRSMNLQPTVIDNVEDLNDDTIAIEDPLQLADQMQELVCNEDLDVVKIFYGDITKEEVEKKLKEPYLENAGFIYFTHVFDKQESDVFTYFYCTKFAVYFDDVFIVEDCDIDNYLGSFCESVTDLGYNVFFEKTDGELIDNKDYFDIHLKVVPL